MKRLAAGLIGSALMIAFAQAAEPAAGTPSAADWTNAQPVASLSVRRLRVDEAPPQLKGTEGLFVIEATIVDLRSGNTLMKPRLIIHRGEPATIEGGVSDRLVMKLTVQVEAASDSATTTTELRDNGVVTSSSTTRFSFAST